MVGLSSSQTRSHQEGQRWEAQPGNRGSTRKGGGGWVVHGGWRLGGGMGQQAGGISLLPHAIYHLQPATCHLLPTLRRMHPLAVPLPTLCVSWLRAVVLSKNAPQSPPESWWFWPESCQFWTRKLPLWDQKVGGSRQKSTSFRRFCHILKDLQKRGPEKIFLWLRPPATGLRGPATAGSHLGKGQGCS